MVSATKNNKVGTVKNVPRISKILSFHDIPLGCEPAQAARALHLRDLARRAEMVSLPPPLATTLPHSRHAVSPTRPPLSKNSTGAVTARPRPRRGALDPFGSLLP